MAAYVYYVRRKIAAFFSRRKKAPTAVLPIAAETGDTREVA
jgi:hypothetical protein